MRRSKPRRFVLGLGLEPTTTTEASTGQWVMLVKSRVLRGNYDWHDILRRDCAQEIKRCQKPGLPERVRTNTQAVLLPAWGGLAKGNQSVQQAKTRVDFLVQQAKVTGLGV